MRFFMQIFASGRKFKYENFKDVCYVNICTLKQIDGRTSLGALQTIHKDKHTQPTWAKTKYFHNTTHQRYTTTH